MAMMLHGALARVAPSAPPLVGLLRLRSSRNRKNRPKGRPIRVLTKKNKTEESQREVVETSWITTALPPSRARY